MPAVFLNLYYCFFHLIICFVTTGLFQYLKDFSTKRTGMSIYGSPWFLHWQFRKSIIFKNILWYIHIAIINRTKYTWAYRLCLSPPGKKIKKIHCLFKFDWFPRSGNIPNLRKQSILCDYTFGENKWTRKSLHIWILCTLKRDDALTINFYISKASIHKNSNHQIENAKLRIKIWNMILMLKLILCSIIKVS